MKKMMRIAAMLASAAIFCGSLSAAPVSALYCWGTTDGSEFQDMTLLDDKGMFSGVPRGEGIGTADNYQVLTYHYSFDREDTFTDLDTGETITEMHHYEGNPVYAVCPRKNWLQFDLREGLDKEKATDQILAVVRNYYPNIQDNIHNPYQNRSDQSDAIIYQGWWNENSYQLADYSENAGSAEIADSLMHDLAEAGLISAFYSWGQTADYQEVWYRYPTAYYPTSYKWNSDYTVLEDVNYDWAAIEVWVNENHPECEFVHVTLEDTESAKEIGYYDYEQRKVYFDGRDEMYAVIPPEGTTFAEHFAIAAELYEQFGLAAEWLSPASAAESPLIGQNALAVAGDINIDCSIDVADAVLLARLCTEDAAVQISEDGMKNADVNADGTLSSDDVIAILKMIAKIE